MYEEFQDISSQNRFHLNTGALKFKYFRQCLAGQARAHWDVAANNQADKTDASFSAAIVEWFANYFEPTAFHDQKQYFLQATKAFSMSVKDTATRVEQIIRYMRFMPGAPAAGTPVYSDTEKKMVLYRLMLPAWRTNFDASGNVITNDAYTWHNLVTYFNSQERRENRRQRAQNGGRGRGASPGRGGRGFGRGRGMTRRAPFQGGRPSQRSRPNGYGRGGRGYAPAPYGNYGYGYQNGNQYQGSGYIPAGGRGRGYAARGRGYAGRGRGPGSGGRVPHYNREARALQYDAGYAACPGRQTRTGQAYMLDEGANNESGNNGSNQNGSETHDNRQGQEHYYQEEYEEMYYGEEQGNEGYEDMYYGEEYAPYDMEMDGYGDY